VNRNRIPSLILSLLTFLLLGGCKDSDQEVIKIDFQVSDFHPVTLYGILANNLFTESHRVTRNQQFADLLQGYKISSRAWQDLNSVSRNLFDFRKVRVGQPYSLFIQPDSVCSLKTLVYEMNQTDFVLFHFEDSLRIEYCSKEVHVEDRTVTGVIESTLSEAISDQGISHTLTNKLVDIMGWQIDFYRLQKKDSFKIVYQQSTVDGTPVNIENIIGIYFYHAARDYWAVPFDQGEGIDYFDLKGNSIRRAFLKYPIEFTHISSRYSLNRFHPVLKVNRPHLGTDLSAATGTPIRSVGDGTIVEAGYNGGSGNYVKVRHNGTYTTGYLHMSKIGQGIRSGVSVKQGQVIGYVGSTGWATGPHLCYRFWKNGIQVVGLKVEIPPAIPV
jgi:murein DD-endopeptidase MepM/ murein hydrolase activator NlpD